MLQQAGVVHEPVELLPQSQVREADAEHVPTGSCSFQHLARTAFASTPSHSREGRRSQGRMPKMEPTMKVNGAPAASPSTPAPIESGAMPGSFPAAGPPVSGLATRSSAATRPRNSPGIFASVKNFLFGPQPPLPEPPPSTLSWPTGHRAPAPPSPEDAVGMLRQGGLPQSMQHPKLAGYRGDVGSDGDITRVEFYLQGQAGLVRVPMTEGDNSTAVAAMQIGGIVAAQLDTPRLGGYERVPASQDIAFRLGRQYVKPALTAQAQPNKLAAFLGTQPEAPPEQADRCKWEAFPLGNGHYLVPAIGLPEYGVPPYSRSACVASMALMRGQPMREIGPKLDRGRPSLEDMGSTLFSHFGVAPEQVEGKTDSEASFAKLVNALQHKLRSNGAATIETGGNTFMLYDIKQAPGSEEGVALVGDARPRQPPCSNSSPGSARPAGPCADSWWLALPVQSRRWGSSQRRKGRRYRRHDESRQDHGMARPRPTRTAGRTSYSARSRSSCSLIAIALMEMPKCSANDVNRLPLNDRAPATAAAKASDPALGPKSS
jgi:hypothetical protein